MEIATALDEQLPKPNLFIVSNGYSFSSEEMQPKLDVVATLPDRWANIVRIGTTVDSTYLDELIPQITRGSTVIISGGDDTVRRTLLGLHKKGFTGEEIDIVIAGAGGENVVAQTLHGKKHHKNPLAILQNGQKRTIFHTEAKMSNQQGDHFRTEEFLFSLGLGASAVAMSRYYNKPEWRERQRNRGALAQWLVKQLCAITAIAHSPTIRTSRGKAIDVTISGGEYSAGRALKYDTNLSSRRENILSVAKHKNLIGNLVGRKLPWGRAPGDTWHGGYGTVRIDSIADAEIDGNNIEPIPAGTTIRFQRAAQGIAVLACNHS